MLTSRFGKVMDSLVARNQTTFTCGRDLADGVMVVTEVFDYAKKVRSECLISK